MWTEDYYKFLPEYIQYHTIPERLLTQQINICLNNKDETLINSLAWICYCQTLSDKQITTILCSDLNDSNYNTSFYIPYLLQSQFISCELLLNKIDKSDIIFICLNEHYHPNSEHWNTFDIPQLQIDLINNPELNDYIFDGPAYPTQDAINLIKLLTL